MKRQTFEQYCENRDLEGVDEGLGSAIAQGAKALGSGVKSIVSKLAGNDPEKEATRKALFEKERKELLELGFDERDAQRVAMSLVGLIVQAAEQGVKVDVDAYPYANNNKTSDADFVGAGMGAQPQ